MEIMKKLMLILAFSLSLMANDIIVKTSSCSVDQTINNFKKIIKQRKLTFFALINHQGNADFVNMKMNESKLIIFGSAKIGTPLIQQDLLVGLDLPVKVLVYQDTDGKVKIAYRDGSWLKSKHVVNSPKLVNKLNKALDDMTTKAGQCKKD